MIKAIIFDIDGTLIDSNAAHAETFSYAFAKFGKRVSFDELITLIGMGADKILEKFLTKREIDKFGDDLTEYRKKIFLEDYVPHLKTFPKLRELFEKIKHDGKIIALASSASDEELEEYRKILKISDLTEAETTSDDAEESKPEPDIFQAALSKLKHIKKEEAIIIGDTPYDAAAANKANIKIIGVLSGGWSVEKLSESGCLMVFKNISEIYQNYDKVISNALVK